MIKILSHDTVMEKLQRLEKILINKNKNNSSAIVGVSAEYERLIACFNDSPMFVYVDMHTGLYKIYHNDLILKFKLANSVADFLMHTHINDKF